MNKIVSPILFIVCLFVAACSDDNNENEPTPLSLEKNYYEIRLERSTTSISITNGSGNISLAIKDENILQAIYAKYEDNEEDNRKGHINLYGKQKGVTTLAIIDDVTKDVEKVEVRVTDCYLAYAIADSNHPALEANTTLFFVNNPANNCYIFAIDKIHGQLYEQPIAKGSYEFFVTADSKEQFRGIPNLRLTYNTDKERNSIDDDATATSYDFQMKLRGEDATSSYVLNYIHAYLGIDWEKLLDNALTKSSAPIDLTMTLTIPDTDYQITGVLSTASMPEHILE